MLSNMYYEVENEVMRISHDERFKAFKKALIRYAFSVTIAYIVMIITYTIKCNLGVVISVVCLIAFSAYIVWYSFKKIPQDNPRYKTSKFVNGLKDDNIFSEKKIDELINEIDEWIVLQEADVSRRLNGAQKIITFIVITPVIWCIKPEIQAWITNDDTGSNEGMLVGMLIAVACILLFIWVAADWQKIFIIGYGRKQTVRYMLKDAKYRLGENTELAGENKMIGEIKGKIIEPKDKTEETIESKDEIAETILRYVNSKDELAFQLNGPWGSGKTYYLKNTIKPRLEKENKVPIYISLNGFKNIEMVNSLLSRKLLVYLSRGRLNKYGIYEFTEKLLNLFSLAELPIPIIGGNFGVNTNPLKNGVKRLKGNAIKKAMKDFEFNNLVILIDDLERISDSLKVKEVFGYLATIQEQWHCKIILISNEEEYKDASEFKNGKEKVVNKSLEFKRSVADVAEDIIKGNLKNIDEKDDTINDWIIDESKFLLSNVDNINLRTVKSVMGTYGELVERIDKEKLSDEQKQQMKKTGFLSIFVLTDCFKRGMPMDDKHVGKLLNTSIWTSYNNQVAERIMSKDDKQDHQEVSDKDITLNYILEISRNKDNGFDENMAYTSEIRDLVVHGSLDFHKFCAQINNIFKESEQIKQQRLNKIQRFRRLSDGELKNSQKDIKDSIDLIRDDFNYLLSVFDMFVFFDKVGLNFIQWDINDFEQQLVSRINNMNVSLLDSVDFMITADRLKEHSTLKNALTVRREKADDEADEEFLEGILNQNWIEKYKTRDFFIKRGFFKMLCDKKIVFEISQAEKSMGINSLTEYISATSSQYVKDVNNNDELKYAREFAEELKRLESKVKGKVQLFNYQELEATVNEIVQAAEKKVNNNHGK